MRGAANSSLRDAWNTSSYRGEVINRPHVRLKALGNNLVMVFMRANVAYWRVPFTAIQNARSDSVVLKPPKSSPGGARP